jgi:hypothetical protein
MAAFILGMAVLPVWFMWGVFASGVRDTDRGSVAGHRH